MPDLLVPLYKLPPRPSHEDLNAQGFVVRRANAFELTRVSEFIVTHFSRSWADEAAAGFARQPVSVFLAIEAKIVVGFAAYEATRPCFFGPTGVAPSHRGRGLGRALLLESLWGLHDLGYAYGIVGAAGPVEFYQKAVGAVVIEGSTPGIYADLLK